jgi:tRNA pseudouridine38-40 synthase
MSPFRRPYEWALGRPLDLQLLQGAAGLILGEHDFSAFAAKPSERLHCRCELRQAEWRRRTGGQGMSFQVAADRFLHHMVRFLVGTMVDIGLGRRPVEDMTRLLATPHNQDTSPPAPPQGLYFVAAEYPADIYLSNEIPVPASV